MNDYRQFIADLYHCSESWGTKTSVSDMRKCLEFMCKEKEPDDYTPDPAIAAQCAEYWNQLCVLYPN